MAKKSEDNVGVGDNARPQLKSLISRIENVNEELKALQDDRKEIFAEAKGSGFDPKIMRILIRRRAMDKAERDEQDAVLDLYETAVGA